MSVWHGVTVLVTGAGGFIGSHLVERLVREGARVRAFVRYNSRGDEGLLRLLDRDVYDSLTVYAGDLRDAEAVRSAAAGADTLFSLGALISIPYSYVNPREVVETNVLGTLNVLMAARDTDARVVVHTSTSEVYGTGRYVPMDESHPLQGQSPYSASKIAADKLVESFHRAYGLPVTTLRPFNTFGPRQSARAVIPTVIAQALACDVVRVGSLDTVRDMTFVTDTVDGFIRIGRCPGAVGEEINIGSGTGVAIGELSRLIVELIGREVRIETDAERVRPPDSEVLRLVAGVEKARAMLGWAPTIALADGLQRTIDWISRHMELYRPGHYET